MQGFSTQIGHNFLMISERIRELMLEGEFSPKKLSEQIHVSDSVILRWCKHDTDLRLKNLLCLADLFRCSLEYLTGRSENASDFPPKSCPPFAERLDEVLRDKKTSYYLLQKRTKISRCVFENWKHGGEPRLYNLIKVANALDCTLDFLVGRE